MQTVTLGRTGLEVSVAGLGCGGHSRLGQGTGNSKAHSVRIVEAAIDLGVNFIDTAQVYGTEEIIAMAISSRRADLVISTKIQIINEGTPALGYDFISGDKLKKKVDVSLRQLNSDYIDILHLHGVMPDQYQYCREQLVPVLEELQRSGKIRFLGLTERFIFDTAHEMLGQALLDDVWDVVMMGFNVINPSAARTILPVTRERNIGTLCMFAVRRLLSDPDALKSLVADLIENRVIDGDKIDAHDPLGFLLENGGARTIMDGAYRFCRHWHGIDVVLTGTGNLDHLNENIGSLQSEPLTASSLARLEDLFGSVNTISGE